MEFCVDELRFSSFTLAVNRAGWVQAGVWEFQPRIQYFPHSQLHVDATVVACVVWYGTCPRDATQLCKTHQHTVVSDVYRQAAWLERQSSRRLWQTIHSPTRFYIFCWPVYFYSHMSQTRWHKPICCRSYRRKIWLFPKLFQSILYQFSSLSLIEASCAMQILYILQYE